MYAHLRSGSYLSSFFRIERVGGNSGGDEAPCTRRFDSNFSHSSKSYSKFGLPNEDWHMDGCQNRAEIV